MASTPEGRVKAALKKLFKKYEPELYYFMPVQQGYGAAALDFHCVFRGFAFMVETKAPAGELTPRQSATAARMAQADCPVFVVRDNIGIGEVEEFLCYILLSESVSPTGLSSYPKISE